MISTDLLETVLADQHDEHLAIINDKGLIKRTAAIRIEREIRNLRSPMAKIITGLRRCGKSTLCHQLLADKKPVYVNFDDDRLFGFKASSFQDLFEVILKTRPNSQVYFFDEIQNVEGWELFVNRLLRKKIDIWITGSNSNLLSRELATHLTGRALSYTVYPFSFSEVLRLEGADEEDGAKGGRGLGQSSKIRAKRQAQLEGYLKTGGLPEVLRGAPARTYHQALFNQILTKDVAGRHPIRKQNELKLFALQVLDRFSTTIGYQALANAIPGMSTGTAKKYLGFLEECYLAFELNPYRLKLKQREKAPRKVYGIDLGLLQSLTLKPTPDRGLFLENLVFLELRAREVDFRTWKEDSFEIDFVEFEGRAPTKLIQVCWDLNHPDTRAREVKAIQSARESVKHEIPAQIITWGNRDEWDLAKSRIKVLSAAEWLLQAEDL